MCSVISVSIDNTVHSGYATPLYATILCDVITATDNTEYTNIGK